MTTLSPRASLDEKLRDTEIIASILGPMASEEERSLKKELENQIALQMQIESAGDGKHTNTHTYIHTRTYIHIHTHTHTDTHT